MLVLYDGTYEGFLTLVYEKYHQKLNIDKIEKNKINTLLFEDIHEVITDEEKAKKVLHALQEKFTPKNLNTITNTFLCDSKNFEMSLLEYIILGFKNQNNLKDINHKSIFFLQELEKELFRVLHRMYGFVRFEELEDNTLYAKIDTKFNVLYFLGKHFLKRLGTNDFIIHDIKREFAFVKHKNKLSIKQVASFDEPTYSNDEEKFKKLWKTFFESVSVKERKNKKLQQNFVPLIYRTYMSEFETPQTLNATTL
jgi:probable DNA metabolism protein